MQKELVEFIKRHRTVKALHVFRNYSALIVVISSAILVSSTNLASGKETSGFLFGYLGSTDNYESPLKNKLFTDSKKKATLSTAKISEPSLSPNPDIKEELDNLPIMSGQALLAENSPIKKDPMEDGGVIVYEVKEGDTVGAIASAHGITTNTILWANEIDNINSIMPGDKIFILPVSGLTYTVQSGDSIETVAKKYKAEKEKIIAFNDLPANGELKVGEEIVIPGGEKEVIRPATPATESSSALGIASRTYEPFGKVLSGKAGTGHSFPYGYCTWYVAQRKYVPWGGNAGTWLYRAKAMGYATGKSPRAGSIIVTSESWWGHVGIVEKVSGDSVTISEMNYKGWAKKSSRTISSKSRVIKGYIY
ncbi:MAG: LysM peptidoglycan-binding domain-containing protein [Patescibacteria group bacterium]